jgi:acyl transferase domain-containing protein
MDDVLTDASTTDRPASPAGTAVPEPIAVVGLSCRLPGAVSPAEFWQLLREGRDAIGRTDGYGTAGSPHRGYVQGVEEFDPGFFGISPREAAAMDPHQRMMLELSWEAVEDAGLVADALRDSRTSVFVGATTHDHAMIVGRRGGDAVGAHTFTGMQRGLIANRVSYALGLRGLSLTVDSAQSSSLVAVHLACAALWRGESELAIAGGVNLILTPESTSAMAELGALSPDGRCAVFDEHANGYVRGEGGAAVVLKPLRRAVADGDDIYCTVLGSATNNDGGGTSLTTPDPGGQEDVLRLAYDRAGVTTGAVQYVELHGTGTQVGDPVEAAALGAVFGAARSCETPLLVGSVKSNIGHLEGAAGIAGFVKVALCLRNRSLPATLHHSTPHHRIPLDELRLRVRTHDGGWPREDERLVAGVSSFGIGGTNCHVVLAEQPASGAAPTTRVREATGLPWLVSGRTDGALRAQARQLLAWLADTPGASVRDVGFSLATTRSAFEHRAAICAEDQPRSTLRAVAEGRVAPGVVTGTPAGQPRPVFVFPGQGCQWTGMAYDLWRSSATFRDHFAACERALAPYIDWSLTEAIADESGDSLNRLERVPITLFAVMVSIARLWQSYGVAPAAVVGASQGEIAAAHVAGALSLEDASYLIARRSSVLADHLSDDGAMVWVGACAEHVGPRLSTFHGEAVVAGINSAEGVSVAGDVVTLDQLVADCAARGIRTKWIPAALPTHSPKVDSARVTLLDTFGAVRPSANDVPIYSSATGGPLGSAELTADHWYRVTRQPVRFDLASRAMLADGHTVFIEMGPHPMLAVDLARTAEDTGCPVVTVASLRRFEGGPGRFRTALAEAWVHGVPVDWHAFFAGEGSRRVKLPTYPFQHSTYREDGTVSTGMERTGTSEPAAVALRDRLSGLQSYEQQRLVSGAVRDHVAAVLGYSAPDMVDENRVFKELGFDSQLAVVLRTRLIELCGLKLPSTLLFEYSTVAALSAHLCDKIRGSLASDSTTEARE